MCLYLTCACACTCDCACVCGCPCACSGPCACACACGCACACPHLCPGLRGDQQKNTFNVHDPAQQEGTSMVCRQTQMWDGERPAILLGHVEDGPERISTCCTPAQRSPARLSVSLATATHPSPPYNPRQCTALATLTPPPPPPRTTPPPLKRGWGTAQCLPGEFGIAGILILSERPHTPTFLSPLERAQWRLLQDFERSWAVLAKRNHPANWGFRAWREHRDSRTQA